MSTRNAIANALLSLMRTRGGSNFATYSRTFETYIDLLAKLSGSSQGEPPAFPALYVFEGVGFGEGGQTRWERKGTALNQRTLTYTIVVYATKPNAFTPAGADISVAGATQLNDLVEIIESCFVPDDLSRNTLTLGGQVSHCWLEGIGELISGDIDPSGLTMQTIPVKILMP